MSPARSYPRLVERFGKEYTRKVILNPRCNLNERNHPIIGECNASSRDTYFTGWKRSLNEQEQHINKIKIKPTREDIFTQHQPSGMSHLNFPDLVSQPGSSMMDPKLGSLTAKIAETLGKIRQPQLTEFYSVGNIIGCGREGIVRPAVELPSHSKLYSYDADESAHNASQESKVEDLHEVKLEGRLAAVKSVDKTVRLHSAHTGNSFENSLNTKKQYREVEVLEQLSKNGKCHPNIGRYIYTFESPVRLHICTELNKGGDLFTYLSEHDFPQLDEKTVSRVLLKLLSAILYVNRCGFIHMDIKLENIMRKEKGDEIDAGDVVLIDFGHAAKVPKSKSFGRLVRPVGSPSYASPEVILDKKFSAKSDIWSLGVVAHIMLQGFLPFPHLQNKKYREFSVEDYTGENETFAFQDDWENFSPECLDLLKRMLEVDSEKRISVEEAANHSWFQKNGFKIVENDDNMPVVHEFSSTTGDNDSHDSDLFGLGIGGKFRTIFS